MSKQLWGPCGDHVGTGRRTVLEPAVNKYEIRSTKYETNSKSEIRRFETGGGNDAEVESKQVDHRVPLGER